MTDPSAELSPVKRALLEVRDLRARLDAAEQNAHAPIAIVGAGLRLPGGLNNLDSFWRFLREGREAIGPVPADRWDNAALFDPNPDAPGKVSTQTGAFVDQAYHFDAPFFGISPREAETMDPQQRLLLEVTWEALENAALAPDKLFGTQTGIFLGISNSDYFRLLLNDPESIDAYITTGNALSVAGGRLSYTLGLHGPNLSVDTACSSSLVAIHLAVQSLRKGECDMALAGGVSLMLLPEITINFSKAHMMSADGRCKTFDAAADGYGRGEGVAMIVLKRLAEAQAAGDPILAVIRGSAINHDGRSGGLTAPNGPAQQKVIRAALADAQTAPEQIGYVEAHGTGTPLGDPIEVHALIAALAENRSPANPLWIGSLKTNLGHLEPTAGVAGLLKAALMLKHRALPPHLNFQTLNPHIQLGAAPIRIPTQLESWEAKAGPRRAGVSSFGLSGTNAHIILEEAPEGAAGPTADSEHAPQLLTLSAKSAPALRELAARYEQHLASAPLADAAYTSQTGRAHFAQRLAVVAGDSASARQKLAAFLAGEDAAGVARGTAGAHPPEMAWLFTGHGAHYVGMGRQLYQSQPAFRAALDECSALLTGRLDQPLLSLLYPEASEAEPLLNRMAYTQPALFSVQYALAKLWLAWGLAPAFMLGHSGGEYVAACLAGVFSLDDALTLVTARGQLLSASRGGGMAAVFADEAPVAEAIAPYAERVSIAAFNGPNNIVISGESSALEAVLETLRAGRIKWRKLAIGQAAHSPLVEPGLDEFERLVSGLKLRDPQMGLVSSVTGQAVPSGEMTQPAYWRRHLRQPVRFASAMQTLHAEGARAFLEIGPNPVLITNGQRCVPAEGTTWLPSLREGLPDAQVLLESVGALYANGFKFDWESLTASAPRRKVVLPTYPFQRVEYRIAPRASAPPAPEAPVWEALTAAGTRQAAQGPLELNPQSYPARWQALEQLTLTYIGRTFRALGALAQVGQSLTVDELLSQHRILPVYRNLMGRWCQHLREAGGLRAEGERFTAIGPLPANLESAWANVQTLFADLPAVRAYLQRCGDNLPAILTGQMSPLETLFPSGASDQAEALYEHWPVSSYFIQITRAVVEAIAHARPSQPLRILELGAGTGATTASLLPGLPAHRATYTFTDVSDLFLNRAAVRFKDFSFVRYGLLDIEKSPAGQGYPAHSFEVVVAANVLHATHQLDETLRNVKELLAPGGVLVINEATTLLTWLDMTTGLIGGWQRFEDGWRGDHPLMAAERWQAALAANGFERVAAWPASGSLTEVLGQHVIAAQAPGELTEATQVSPIEGAKLFAAGPEATTEAAPLSIIEQVREALPVERADVLAQLTRAQVARVLRLNDPQAVDPAQRLLDMGLDSLMALELRKRLADALALPEKSLSATLVFDYPTVTAIANYLLTEVLALTEAPSAPIEAPPAPDAARQARAEAVAQMSDDEVEALLLQKLSKGK